MDAMGGSLKRSNTFNGRDFVAMNKAATKKGLHTSSDFAKYKFTHNVEKQPMTMDTNTNSELLFLTFFADGFNQPLLVCMSALLMRVKSLF